jgi:hypothetical protein
MEALKETHQAEMNQVQAALDEAEIKRVKEEAEASSIRVYR